MWLKGLRAASRKIEHQECKQTGLIPVSVPCVVFLTTVKSGTFSPEPSISCLKYIRRYDSNAEELNISNRRLMGRTCSTNGGRGMHIGYWWESQKEIDH
jgi:hypothetical protein